MILIDGKFKSFEAFEDKIISSDSVCIPIGQYTTLKVPFKTIRNRLCPREKEEDKNSEATNSSTLRSIGTISVSIYANVSYKYVPTTRNSNRSVKEGRELLENGTERVSFTRSRQSAVSTLLDTDNAESEYLELLHHHSKSSIIYDYGKPIITVRARYDTLKRLVSQNIIKPTDEDCEHLFEEETPIGGNFPIFVGGKIATDGNAVEGKIATAHNSEEEKMATNRICTVDVPLVNSSTNQDCRIVLKNELNLIHYSTTMITN